MWGQTSTVDSLNSESRGQTPSGSVNSGGLTPYPLDFVHLKKNVSAGSGVNSQLRPLNYIRSSCTVLDLINVHKLNECFYRINSRSNKKKRPSFIWPPVLFSVVLSLLSVGRTRASSS